jgi:hypothetical protein
MMRELRYFNERTDPKLFAHIEEMHEEFLYWLDEVRHRAGVPFIITSGWRTGKGLHPLGRAVDFTTPGSRARDAQKYYEDLYKITKAVMTVPTHGNVEVQFELVKGPDDWHVHIGWYELGWPGPSKLVLALD